MDLSFEEKKTVCNTVLWFLNYQAKPSVNFFWDALYTFYIQIYIAGVNKNVQIKSIYPSGETKF